MGERLQRVLSAGWSEARPQQQNTYTRRSNALAIFAFTASAPFGPLLFSWGFPGLGALVGAGTCCYLLPFWFNSRGHYTAGKLVLPLTAMTLCGVICLWFGRACQAQLCLFAVLTFPFQLFDTRTERRALLAPVVCSVLLFVAVQAEWLPTLVVGGLSEGTQFGLRLSLGLVVMWGFVAIMGYFYHQNQGNETQLYQAVQQLTEAIERQKLTELSLQEARDEARLAAKAKGDFLALVSHELCTPLHGILGSASELQHVVHTPDGIKLVEMLRISGERLDNLLQSLVDFVGLDSANASLKRAAFDAVDLLEDVLLQYAPAAHRRGIVLDGQIDSGAVEQVVGDPLRLRRVVAALLDNATRYTIQGSVLLVATFQSESPQLTFRVEDTGPGIPAELKPRLFQPFEQAVAMKHRGMDGLGIGLALVSKLVLAMGGQIELKDRAGGGTVVSVTLPLGIADSGAIRPTPLAHRKVCLDVEESGLRQSLQLSLGRAGAQLTARASDADCILSTLSEKASEGALNDSPPRWTVLAQPAPGASRCLVRPVVSASLLEALARKPEAAPVQSSEKPRVLIAEDNKVSRKLISRMMKRLGFEVTATEDGQQALDAWRSSVFDLAVLDIQMPVMDGMDAARNIRQGERAARQGEGVPESRVLSRLPIVFLTANTSAEQEHEARAIGVEHYMHKPCHIEQLQEVLGNLGFAIAEGSRSPARPKTHLATG